MTFLEALAWGFGPMFGAALAWGAAWILGLWLFFGVLELDKPAPKAPTTKEKRK